jgi:transcription-repair coupling factor (superfamily II helicase)
MYVKLIEEAVREVRGELGEEVDIETRVELKVDAYLPAEYVRGEFQRIEMYKRIAAIEDRADRMDVEDELTDRFGDPPEPVTNLVSIAHLKALCGRLGIESVVHRAGQVIMKFSPHARVDGARLVQALHGADKRLSLAARQPPSLVLRGAPPDATAMLADAVRVMETLVERIDQAQATG